MNKGYKIIPYRLLLLSGLISLFLLAGCNRTTNKLTDSNFNDLSVDPLPQRALSFPAEIEDSLGWGNLVESSFKKKQEEFRFVLTSNKAPYHLFKISNRKGIKGESILFWEKETSASLTDAFQNMEQHLNGRCSEFKETAQYQYCTPIYSVEPNWEQIYNALERDSIWTLSGQSSSAQSGNSWKFNTQVRHGNYYRSYSYTNPDQSQKTSEILNALSVITQLNRVSESFLQADNFNTYSGITSGKLGSTFTLCDESEVWRFQSDLVTLVNSSGLPFSISSNDGLLFYVSVQGTLKDEWYANRENSGVQKTLFAEELNHISLVSKNKCPDF